MLPPFNFPKPLIYILEGSPANNGIHSKYMALFEIKDRKLLGQGDGMSLDFLLPRTIVLAS
jgi:hypothetical protein